MTQLLLIDPPRGGLLEGATHALVSLADWVQRRAPGAVVEILDWAALPEGKIPAVVRDALPPDGRSVVGITATTATYQAALAVARAFKRADGTIQVVMGGHHVTPEADVVLGRHPEIDVIVRGEGERPLLDLARGIPLADIPGISFRTATGKVVRNAAPLPLSTAELDTIATEFPGINSEPGKFHRLTYMSARGCPLACRFCVVAQQPVRARSVAQVIADLRRLVEKGFRRFTIEDNFFAQAPKRTLALCGALARLQESLDPGFIFDCQTRVESCTEQIVPALAAAGCDAVFLGVEALVPRQLTLLGKTPVPDRFLARLRHSVLPLLFTHGIEANLNLQVGVPGATELERDMTLHQLAELGRRARERSGVIRLFPQLHVVYPGTAEFVDYLNAGAFPRDIFESFTEWESAHGSVLAWMGARFAHGAGGIPIALLDPDALRSGGFALREEEFRSAERLVEAFSMVDSVEVFDYRSEVTLAQEEVEVA